MELYPEFTPIYVGIAVIFALLLVIIVLLIMVLMRVRKQAGGERSNVKAIYGGKTGAPPSGNVAFCRNCATEFEASEKNCPKCGTPR